MDTAAGIPNSIMVIAAMVALGTASILFGLWRHQRRAEAAVISAGWAIADGTILSVEVNHVRSSDSPDDYIPRVRYSYRVGLKQYESDRLRAGGRTVFHHEPPARAAIANYRAGSVVRVRYDPERHERSVLETVPAPSDLRGWVICGIFLLASATYAAITVLFPAGFG